MSGKTTYDERKRLEAENALLRERQINARLKQEKRNDELGDLFAKSITQFLTGTGSIVMTPRSDGGFNIRFEGSSS